MTHSVKRGTNQHVAATADRFRALREAIGLAQGGFEGVSRTEVNKIENGVNQLTGGDLRMRVAKAVGLSTDDLTAYLTGRIGLPDVLARRAKRAASSVPPSAAKWAQVDPETRRRAIVYLKQKPQAFTDEAISQAFEELRISDPERAKSPREVADAVRVVILGVIAALPPEAPVGTRRSS
jgi:transcriptional regulator with XRE-family HTH domain